MAFNGYTPVKSFIPPLLKPLLFQDLAELDDWPDFLLWLHSNELKFSASRGGDARDSIFTVTRKNLDGESGEYLSCWGNSLEDAINKAQRLMLLMDDPAGPLKQIEVAIKDAEKVASAFIEANLSKLTISNS